MEPRDKPLSRHSCRRCGGSYWPWQSILEHKPDCLYRREAEAAIAKRKRS